MSILQSLSNLHSLCVYYNLNEIDTLYVYTTIAMKLTLFSRTPSGLEDVSKYPALFASLLASGAWSLDDLKKLAGLNFLRIFREVERVRRFFRRNLIPLKSIFQE